MAYIRTVKASFFTSDDIVTLSPLARLLYIALWTEADRKGRFTWRPGNFKLRFLPGDQCDINALCSELLESGLVATYLFDGKTYAEIPTFKRHQSINNREGVSTLPPRITDATGTRGNASMTREDATGTPLVGKERKGSHPPCHGDDYPTLINCIQGKIPSGINSAGCSKNEQGGDDEF
jgi:hypothetical protein